MFAGASQSRHELKTWPRYFEPVIAGIKTAEYRKDDRGFCRGDTLWLREWTPEGGYTGREACAVITHITTGAVIPEGYAMLSFGRVTVWFARDPVTRSTVEGGAQ
jgi:hypothetical protein